MKSPHGSGPILVEAEALKARLGDLRRAKIRRADEVLVVGDYIGDSRRAESPTPGRWASPCGSRTPK